MEYFLATAAIDAIGVELERSIAVLRERAHKDGAQARSRAEESVQSMLTLGASRSEVAARLGIPARTIRRPEAASEQVNTDVVDDNRNESDGQHHG